MANRKAGDPRIAIQLAQAIQSDFSKIVRNPTLPSEVQSPSDQPVLPSALFTKSKGYSRKVVDQINATYSATCYDACAVMIRRLLETLIIEVFEHNKMAAKIQDSNSGDFLTFEKMIDVLLAEKSWNIGRGSKRAFKTFRDAKHIGDHSAHNRRYNAHREYIDEMINDLRVVVHELLDLAGQS